MRKFEKPRIVISRCLGQAKCRYDGAMIHSDLIDGLAPYVDYVSVCPEVEIGLPVPREAMRIVRNEAGEDRMVFSVSGVDKTEEMRGFASSFLDKLDENEVDAFILKHRSPSCGMNDVKIYKGTGKSSMLPGKTTGLFADAVQRRFPHIPIENEGRLLNFNLREQFMIRVFMMRDFKKTKSSGKVSSLTAFHAANKYLLMTFSQRILADMGKIAANQDGKSCPALFSEYEALLVSALSQQPSISRNINVLLHVLGYFKKYLNSAEKSFFLEQLELYNQKRIPFSVMLGVLKSWVVRFDEPYLKGQTLFEPFPSTLFEVTDSGKGL